MRAFSGVKVDSMDSQSETESRKGKGFTLIEMLVSFLLFAVVSASAIGLLRTQRNLYDVQYDRMDLQRNVRGAVDLVAGELRSIPDGGVITGSADSLVVRYPIRWGLVCGDLNKAAVKAGDPPPPPAPDAEIYMPTAVDQLFADQVQSGLGFRDENGVWTYIEDSLQPWEDSLFVETLIYCTGGPGAKVQKDKFDKEGNLVERGDTAVDPNYGRFFGFYSYVGFEAYQGAQIVAYANVTYRFGASEFDPGTRALFRVTPNGAQELAGLFDSESGFEYIVENGQMKTNLPPGHLEKVVAIRIKAFATKDNQAGGASRTLDYDATVDVPLRNSGDEL
jgi:prepilin-type N-terminal cleavage/methylation domain-containing protein